MKIGIVGNGIVGGHLRQWFTALGHSVAVYDILPERSTHMELEATEGDWVFLCPYLANNGRGEDYAILRRLLGLCNTANPVVIRSTVVPGTCDTLTADTGEMVIFCPEFLTEANADEDFATPHMQVVGAREEDGAAAQALLQVLPEAPFQCITTVRQAELLKHVLAGWLATKVSWFNQLHDAVGLYDYLAVVDVLKHDPRVGATHMDVGQDGYRGWGGKCFTKDVPALAQVTRMGLLEAVVEYNTKLKVQQAMTKREGGLHE